MKMKEQIKALVFGIPGLGNSLQRLAYLRHERQLLRKSGLARLQKDFLHNHPPAVQSGPFEGMVYLSEAAGSTFLPKLLGSYEAELHPALTELVNRQPTQVVDVGCAEGYYAVGLARLLPSVTVFAFDTDPRARRLCAEMARLNSVSDRVSLKGICNWKSLSDVCIPGTLIICDCEGFEFTLLDPDRAGIIRRCDLLIELHPEQSGKNSEVLLSRFTQTHHAWLIDSTHRDPSSYKALANFSPEDQGLAVSELRNHWQQWALLTVKN